jgi:hypothetical protein
MRGGVLFLLSSLLLVGIAPAASGPGQGTPLPRPDAVVRPRVFVSHEPVPRGQVFEVAIVGEVLEGFHINAHKVLQDYLIPTVLTPELPKGIRLVEMHYPEGVRRKFAFASEEMAVYEGKVTLRMKLQATSEAPLGKLSVPVELRYQACNDTTCLPPVRIPLKAEFVVAREGAAFKKTHPQIFGDTRLP